MTELLPTAFPYAPNIFLCLTGSGVGMEAFGMPKTRNQYNNAKIYPYHFDKS